MINALFARLEEVASNLGVAVLLINHTSRTYDFDVNDLLGGKMEEGQGIWGGYSLMYNMKYILQLEFIPLEDGDNRYTYGNRMARYIIRRLWPALYPKYVIAEILKDYGYEDFDATGQPVDLDVDERIHNLEKSLKEIEG